MNVYSNAVVTVNLIKLLIESGYKTDTVINGCWVKRITGLDRRVTNGWSLEGEFAQDLYEQAEQEVGLYLIRDTVKNPNEAQKQAWIKRYVLFELSSDGSVQILDRYYSNGRAWAKKFWGAVDRWFDQQKDSAAKLSHLVSYRDYLQRELERVNNEIASMRLPEDLLDSDGQCRAVVLSSNNNK